MDLSTIRNHAGYRALWKRIGRIRITMAEKHKVFRIHRPDSKGTVCEMKKA